MATHQCRTCASEACLVRTGQHDLGEVWCEDSGHLRVASTGTSGHVRVASTVASTGTSSRILSFLSVSALLSVSASAWVAAYAASLASCLASSNGVSTSDSDSRRRHKIFLYGTCTTCRYDLTLGTCTTCHYDLTLGTPPLLYLYDSRQMDST